MPILLVLATVTLAAGGVWLFLHWGIADLPPGEAPYARMARLARLFGRGAAPAQTPHEFAASLGASLPSAAPAAAALADAYVGSRWSRGRPAPTADLDAAWRQVRDALLRSVIPRPLSPWERDRVRA